MLRTLLIQTVLTTSDLVKAAVTTFDLYCIMLINNQTYVLREKNTHLGYTKILLFPWQPITCIEWP